MWCTQCHVAFDWKTGRLETGRIHNPHYFEFKKRSREHGDIPCGGRPTHNELKDIKASSNILLVSLEVIHIEYLLIYRYAYIYEDNRHLRMRYLLKDISEEKLKRELQRRDKSNAKLHDIRDILQMYIDTVGDLLRQYVLNNEEENNILTEIHELTVYTNDVLERIRKRYVCRTPHNIILSIIK